MTTPNPRDTGSLLSSTEQAEPTSETPENGVDRESGEGAGREELDYQPEPLANPQGAQLPPQALAENPDRES